mmetsp:Transcript_56491/g.134164  ORF Transcript_56491/g.134164 Transcript_56491/m.134164 type:complete len:235 (+) Transcript_56491:399-1103(+)
MTRAREDVLVLYAQTAALAVWASPMKRVLWYCAKDMTVALRTVLGEHSSPTDVRAETIVAAVTACAVTVFITGVPSLSTASSPVSLSMLGTSYLPTLNSRMAPHARSVSDAKFTRFETDAYTLPASNEYAMPTTLLILVAPLALATHEVVRRAAVSSMPFLICMHLPSDVVYVPSAHGAVVSSQRSSVVLPDMLRAVACAVAEAPVSFVHEIMPSVLTLAAYSATLDRSLEESV